jgi:putative transposase
MIVGGRVAAHMRTGMVLDAIEMARWSRGTQLEGLRTAELGAVPSIGTVGDSYDNALAETVNGLYPGRFRSAGRGIDHSEGSHRPMSPVL